MTTSVARTTVWCQPEGKFKRRHRLRVEAAVFVAAWSKMSQTERTNGGGAIKAFCPDPKCPEHDRTMFVGSNKIPELFELVKPDNA